MLKKCPRCLLESEESNFRPSKGPCRDCERKYSREYRALNREKIAAYNKKYFNELRPEYSKEWKTKNAIRHRKNCRNQREKNREKIRARKKYSPERDGEYQRTRRDKIVKSSLWGRDRVKQIIKEQPKGMFLDHIIPLFNENVCGLHVPENLQYLSPSHSSIKANSFDFTWDNNSWRMFI